MTYEWWLPTGAWEGNRWVGRAQVEDKSPENIHACYEFLRSRPYTTEEDNTRLHILELIAIAEELMG
jgi:hypothetical protein